MLAYDRTVAAHAAVVLSLLLLAAWGVLILTDEAVSTHAMRSARLAVLCPGFGALSVILVDSIARSRGDARALEALGASPLRRLSAAIGVSWVAGAAACAILALPISDVRSLFPAIVQTEWQVRAHDFQLAAAGVVIDSSLWPRFEIAVPAAAGASLGPGRAAAVALCAPLAALAPLWAASPSPVFTRCLVVAATAIAAVVVLHAVAAGRSAEWSTVLASIPFLGHLLVGSVRRARSG